MEEIVVTDMIPNPAPDESQECRSPKPKLEKKRVSFSEISTDIDTGDSKLTNGSSTVHDNSFRGETVLEPDAREAEADGDDGCPYSDDGCNSDDSLEENPRKPKAARCDCSSPSVDSVSYRLNNVSLFRSRYDIALKAKSESMKELGNIVSIPKARLAFVTDMVENMTPSCEEPESISNPPTATDQDPEESKSPQTADELEIEAGIVEKVKKIFNGHSTPATDIPEKLDTAVTDLAIDRSSILEHKEEIIQLWEKRMMSNEEPASLGESAKKEESEELPAPVHQNGDVPKIANGTVHRDQSESAGNENDEVKEKLNDDAPQGERRDSNKTDDIKLTGINVDETDGKTDSEAEKVEESKATDESLKPEVVASSIVETEEVTEEKIYTTTLQQTLVVSKTEQVEVVEERVAVTPTVSATAIQEDSQDDFEEMERRIEAEESLIQINETKEEPREEVEEDSITQAAAPEISETKHDEPGALEQSAQEKVVEEEHPSLSDQAELADSLEDEPQGKRDEVDEAVVLESLESKVEKPGILMNGVPDDEYRPLADFLPPADNDNIEEDIATNETAFPQNGEAEEKTFDDHFVLDTRELVSPDVDKKESSGKKSRIHTLGVQKTEQPYSTCTTETKIAMEIREMREREEELKLMRERQAQLSPAPPPPQKHTPSPTPSVPTARTPPLHKPASPLGYAAQNSSKISTPGYRPSSVFGHRAVAQQAKDESKFNRNFNKESAVEKEIRLAKDREEELRRQKGLPPREDDSYVKPSQVKSSQARVFGKISNAETSRLLATAKIQHEIEEQTQRELALRESGHIQTLSTERTDSKVTKLKPLDLTPECLSPTFQNGASSVHSNGMFTNGHVSPDHAGYKRSTPSPTGSNYSSSSYTMPRSALQPNTKGISMQKFIASRGKETTFSAPRNGPFSSPRSPDYQDNARTLPEPGKLKRTVSVESKIQQEIMEMKLREEELRMMHARNEKPAENDDYDPRPRSPRDLSNGQSGDAENPCPRRNNLIAQWEQMIQNAEGRA